MTDVALHPTDAHPLPVEKPGNHPNNAQTEAQNLLHKNEKPAPNTTAERTVHNHFGTPTITGDAKPAAPANPKSEAPRPEAPKPEAPKPEAPKPEAQKPEPAKPSESWGQWTKDHLWGAAVFGEEMVHGAEQSAVSMFRTVGHVAEEAKDATVKAYHEAPAAIQNAVAATEHAGSELIHHPGSTLVAAGHAIEHATVEGAEATWHGAKKVGKLIADHPVETAIIAAAVVTEVVTLGGATPLMVGLGAIGTGFAAHDVVHAVENVRRDEGKIAPLFNSSQATPEQVKEARAAVAHDTGAAVVDVAALATGLGIARLAKGAEIAHAIRTAKIEEGVADVGKLEPVIHAVTSAGVKGAEICQAAIDHSSTISNVATVGGNGAPPVTVADERDRHKQFNAQAPAP